MLERMTPTPTRAQSGLKITEAPPGALFLRDVAELLGVRYETVTSYLTRSTGGFPDPDGRELGQKGRTRPWWYPETITGWQTGRPGMGNYAGKGLPRGPYGSTGQRAICPNCERSTPIVQGGFFRVHGSREARCLGSGKVATPQRVKPS